MFTPPQRQSMSDSELQEALGVAHANEAGILGAMELLEQQSALREADDQAFNKWVSELTQIGSPEALHAIENAKRAIAGLEPIEFEAPSSEPAVHSEQSFETAASEIAETEQQIVEPAAVFEPIAEQPVPSTSEVQDDFAASLNRLYSISQPEQHSVPKGSSDEIELEVQHPAIDSTFDEESSDLLVEEAQGIEQSLETADDNSALAEPEPLEVQSAQAEPAASLDSDVAESQQSFESLIAVASESLSASTATAIRTASKSNFSESPIWRWVALFGAGTALFTAFSMKILASNFATAAVAVTFGMLFAGLTGIASVRATWRSGQSSLVTSRAAFGVFGNVLPGIVSIAGRVVLFAASITTSISIAISRQASSAIGLSDSVVVGAVAISAIMLGLALARITQVFNKTHFVLAAIVIVLSVALVATPFSTTSASAFEAGSVNWAEAFMLAAIIFGVFVSLVSPSAISAERLDGSKGKKFLTLVIALIAVPIAVTIPTLYAVFATANALSTAPGFTSDSAVVDALAIAAAVLSVIAWSSLQVLSISSSFVAVVPKLGSRSATVTSMLLIAIVVAAFSISLGQGNAISLLGFSAHLAAIPVLAWAGVFVADALLRTVAYHDVSLMRSYGFYKPVNFANLAAWLVATAFGFAVFKAPSEVAAGVGGFGFAIAPRFVSSVVESGASPFIVFGLAFLGPILFGIPRIRSQEQEVLALEARRDDLKDIFKFGE